LHHQFQLSLRAQRSNLVPTETPRHEIASSRKALLAMTGPIWSKSALMCLAILIRGGGPLSLDSRLGREI
jgi:hypothetical protein